MIPISSSAPYYIEVPIIDSFGEYQIYIGDSSTASNLIYSGKVYGDGLSVNVNIQPILVNYIPSTIAIPGDPGHNEWYYDTFPTYNTIRQDFTITRTNTSIVKNINMLYCTENVSNKELGWGDNWVNNFPIAANDYIQKKFVNDTLFSTMYLFNSIDDSTNIVLTEKKADGTTTTSTWQTVTDVARASGILNFDSSTVSFSVSIDGFDIAKDIEVVHCVPENTYILYYVNTFGAIDYIICDKKNSITYDADRHTMTQYADISDRSKFGKRTYLNNTTRTWTLNTDIMTDEQSEQMYKLFNSPYVWLYDANNGTTVDEWGDERVQLTSVIIEDASLKIKKFATDKIYNYTIKVKDSQTFTIQ